MTASPSGRGQVAPQVLAGRDQQPFDVHALQATEPEAPQAVPLLGLGEQRLDPNLPLAHRLPVRLRLEDADGLGALVLEWAEHRLPGVASGSVMLTRQSEVRR